jgi:hypothetical protein
MLNAVIRRRDYLMDEIREPVKVVSLVGTIDPCIPSGDEPRFDGSVAAYTAIIFLIGVLAALVALAANLK